MIEQADAIEPLQQALGRAPVMGNFHPLVPLCLPFNVEIVAEADMVVEWMDDLLPQPERPILITNYDTRFTDRFLVQNVPDCPPPELINRSLPFRLDTARSCLLTHRHVAERIVTDTLEHGYQTVILLLVDGLSYEDVRHWSEQPAPCFIDGPSITFSRLSNQSIVSTIGFPGIVGTPPLSRRLAEASIPHARGYSYWDREQNDVSANLFSGMPLTKTSDIADTLDRVSSLNLTGVYIQIVREGLDGLAHRRREVTNAEIEATIEAIHRDYRQLINLVGISGVKGAVYLMADHGILWRRQHRLELDPSSDYRADHPRYATRPVADTNQVTKFRIQSQDYYLFHYPHLGAKIKSNDSGVHGGLSYWESIVPFVRVEVNL